MSSPLLKSRRRGNAGSPVADNNASYQPEEEKESTLSLGIPIITPEQQQQQQQLVIAEQDRYIESRSTAIESIESTIAELGSIFQQLATMVAEQREQVQRYVNSLELNFWMQCENSCIPLFLGSTKTQKI